MKLKKSLFSNTISDILLLKFKRCSRNSLKRGDYIRVKFLTYETHKKGGGVFRLNTITGILLKKKITFTGTMFLVSVNICFEKIRWRLQLFSPLVLSITYLKSSFNKDKLIKLAN